jgi:NhaP-type Na+/H+ or K+/H+ antiporter
MIPVAIALAGVGFRPSTVAFIGWFGPRGLASIVFLIVGLEGLQGAGIDAGPFAAVVAWTVVLSVVLHGLSAGPLAARYARRVADLPPTSPEREDEAEPQPSRVTWAGRIRPGPSI